MQGDKSRHAIFSFCIKYVGNDNTGKIKLKLLKENSKIRITICWEQSIAQPKNRQL